ncbi:MAG: transglycosylase domain-containing protein [bacterium]
MTYFGKDPREPSTAEAATLAGILPAPSAYNPLQVD